MELFGKNDALSWLIYKVCTFIYINFFNSHSSFLLTIFLYRKSGKIILRKCCSIYSTDKIYLSDFIYINNNDSAHFSKGCLSMAGLYPMILKIF